MKKFLALTTAALMTLAALSACSDTKEPDFPRATAVATAVPTSDLETPIPVLTPSRVRTLVPEVTLSPVPKTTNSPLLHSRTAKPSPTPSKSKHVKPSESVSPASRQGQSRYTTSARQG